MEVNEVMLLKLYYEDTRPKEIKPFKWSGFHEEEMVEFLLNSFPNVCRHIRDTYNKHELEDMKIIAESISLISTFTTVR